MVKLNESRDLPWSCIDWAGGFLFFFFFSGADKSSAREKVLEYFIIEGKQVFDEFVKTRAPIHSVNSISRAL